MSFPIHTQLPISGAYLIEYRAFGDSRGYLAELYNSDKYLQAKTESLSQITLSQSRRAVLRGIHKVPYSKLVSCVSGAIYDVIVDLRPDSPTYLMWLSVVLTPINRKQLYIPSDCGHAFLSLENDSLVVYGQSQPFNPSLEDNVRFDDPYLNVFWPCNDINQLEISPKDRDTPLLTSVSLPKEITPKRTRVLIVGASGQLGSILSLKLKEYFQSKYVVFGTYCANRVDTHCVQMDLDCSEKNAFDFKTLLQLCRPGILIICAAMTWVDGCEKSPEKAYNINCNAAFSLSLEAKHVGAKTVYISTDYVFGGVPPIHGDRYMEEDRVAALNVYGSTKHRGEQLVLAVSKRNLVLRTSSLYGPDIFGKNFPCQVMRKLRENAKVQAFTHVVSTPTYTVDISNCLIQLLEYECSGVMHLAGPESVSRYEWALKVAETFQLDSSSIERTSSYPTLIAKRPLNSSLATNRLGYFLPHFKFRSVDEGLKDWKENYPHPLDDTDSSAKSKL